MMQKKDISGVNYTPFKASALDVMPEVKRHTGGRPWRSDNYTLRTRKNCNRGKGPQRATTKVRDR
jgi:hypothetical protein